MDSLVKGDTGSAVRITCVDNITSQPIVLSDSTVKLQWKANNVLVEKTMTIIDAAKGIVQYTFGTDELVPPSMSFDVVITNLLTQTHITCKDILTILVRDRV